MEITWLGHACFRLRGRDSTVITDPFDASLGYPMGRWSASVVTVSHDHPGHNNVGAVSSPAKVVRGPGEYEIAQVLITGHRFYHDAEQGRVRGRNTVYVIDLDELRVGHLGDLGHVLTAEQAAALGPVDILLIPVGGATTLDSRGAMQVVNRLEPSVVIPMHYHTPALRRADLAPAERFLQEMGASDVSPVPRFNVTRATLPQDSQVILLDYPH